MHWLWALWNPIFLGDFYYKSYPVNSEPKFDYSKECECIYYYYIEEILIGGIKRKLYHCLEKNENCPTDYKFHNLGDKECIQKCSNSINTDDLTKNYYQGDNNICYKFDDCKYIN